MDGNEIKGIYKVEDRKRNHSVIFSVSNNNNPLRYDYYILTIAKNGSITIRPIQSPIVLARDNKFSIKRISESSPLYKEYADKIAKYDVQLLRRNYSKDNNHGLKLRRNDIKK